MNYFGARKDITLYRPGREITFSDIHPRKEMQKKQNDAHIFIHLFTGVWHELKCKS